MVLEFQTKLKIMEQEKLVLLDLPEKKEKENKDLLLENNTFQGEISVQRTLIEQLENKIKDLEKKLAESNSVNVNLESGIKINLRKTEATIEGLQIQVDDLIHEMADKEKKNLQAPNISPIS